jgi:aminomethyltransferase
LHKNLPPLPSSFSTTLNALHLDLGAKFVPFAGYQMPLNYPTGIIQEHKHTRKSASLFDVSHMGQIRVVGDRAAACLESTAPADIIGLAPGRQCYSYLTNHAGGIADDFIVMNINSGYQLVVNAANTFSDLDILQEACRRGCEVEHLSTHSLIALQGPLASGALAQIAPEISHMRFMDVRAVELGGSPCTISRSGYTGEDGFEISIPSDSVESLARALLQIPGIRPAGLGARDSLRLEAGLCLHGNDIGPQISPVEANIAWAIPKVRRKGGAREGGFPGAAPVLSMLAEGPPRVRVGIRADGRAPVRAQTQLETSVGKAAGEVTSGGFGPSIGGPVAMAYVDPKWASPGTQLWAIVRNKHLPVTVAPLPFVPLRYHRS